MKFNIVTIFPEMLSTYLEYGIIKRAIQSGKIYVRIFNLRDYTKDKHRTVDDYPYGGGSGMVMKPEPFFNLINTVWPDKAKRKVIMLSPQGKLLKQDLVYELSNEVRELVFLCGRYEAIDERVKEYLVDEEISIGDYILTGGELPSLVIIDAIARLVPGVLGDYCSTIDESFTCGLLDYPHYTRPEELNEIKVPEVLLSGNHAEIKRWRKKQSLKNTLIRRPDLLVNYKLSDEEKLLLQEIKEEMNYADDKRN